MKTILVATDFSPAASNAANYAVKMAVAVNASVLLLHVYQMPPTYFEVPIVVTGEDVRKDAEKQIKELMNELIQKTDGRLDIKTEVKAGVFFQELSTICEHVKPSVVVLGSQGKTAIERLFFGSQAVYAMQNLMWPLITVPPKSNFSSIKKIGLACDFNHVNTIPTDEIKILVNDFNAELHIINTDKKDEFNPEIVFGSDLLQKMLEPLKINYHFIAYENIDDGIMDFADKNQIDLLIVFPKRHDFFDKLVHKSHAKQLILHSRIPTMVLHQ